MIISLLEVTTIAGYIEKINLKVTAQIAKPILNIVHDEKISGNYSDINKIPEYFFEIKNYNDENMISEIDFNVKFEAVSKNQIEFEVINCDTGEVILNNDQKNNEITIEKNKQNYKKYKIIVKENLITAKDDLKIIIDAKYFKQELEVFDISFDKRELEYQIFISEIDKKYTNNDVTVQIKCNKEIKAISGFELSSDRTCLTKIYHDNSTENIVIEDYFNNKKNIEISVNNIDKIAPEISGIENGVAYSDAIKLVYKDNIGIKNIKVENTSKKQKYNISFDLENKIIDNQFLVVDNNSINPYYLNQSGNYIITVIDFAGNQTVKHISIK